MELAVKNTEAMQNQRYIRPFVPIIWAILLILKRKEII